MLGTILYTRKPISLIKTDNPVQSLVWATAITGVAKLLVILLLFGTLLGNSPVQVLQFIGSGLMGSRAFTSGVVAIGVGIALHFALLFSLVWLLYILYPLVSAAGKWRWVVGVVYGLGIWFFLNFVLLPLSYAPQVSFGILFHVLSAAADVLFAGLPMALIIGRYYAAREQKMAIARELFDPSSIYY